MKTSSSLLRILLIATLAQVGLSSFAAEPVPSSGKSSAAAPLAQQPGRINFNFPGGTLAKFVSLLAQEKYVTFNLIGAGSTADFETELPPFSLHNATGLVIAQVLKGLLLSRGYEVQISPSDENTVTCVLLPLPKKNDSDSFVRDQFQSFELSPYLGNSSVDQIVDASRSAWELNPDHNRDALRMKFHPGTGILLVSGPSNAIMIAQNIIGNLRTDRLPKNQTQSPAARP